MPFRCSYCLTTVKSQRGLRQHIDGKPECRAKEKERAGLVDMSTLLSLKSPPVASIPKRTYDDFMSPSVSPSLDFDVSELDALLGLTKPKRARRLFGRVEGREPGLSKEAIEALAMKKLTCIAGTKIEAVMDLIHFCLHQQQQHDDLDTVVQKGHWCTSISCRRLTEIRVGGWSGRSGGDQPQVGLHDRGYIQW